MIPGPAWLFCPADRPDRYAKAAAAADAVILDLEDAVAPERKDLAREALAGAGLDPARTLVRINPAGTADHAADLEALRRSGFRIVMLAKTESVADLDGLGGYAVVGLCETPRGVLAAPALAERCAGLMWGAEDLVAAIGGRSSRSAAGGYRDVALHARSSVLLAAAAAGTAAVDSVWLDIADLAGLAAEAADAAASGFAYKACIHPTQVAAVREAFRPTEKELTWARRVVSAEDGVSTVDGRMVDAPLVAQARRTLAASGEPG